VLVTGASGMIGSALAPALAAAGCAVLRLDRRPRPGGTPGAQLKWDPAAGVIAREPLEGLDAAVHLAGASLAGGRWTPARRALLVESRVGSLRLLARTLGALERPPRVLVSASAVGIYGDRGDELLSEASGPGTGFLAELAQAWEQAAEPAARRGIRVVAMRFGLVLAPRGGVLAPLLPLFRLGLGGHAGTGRQWLSWIALDDLIAALRHALADESLGGPVNAVAPGAVTNRELARVLARVLGRPAWFAAPAWALRLALGRMADELLLASQRVEPVRLLASGFSFRFPALEPALRHVLAAA